MSGAILNRLDINIKQYKIKLIHFSINISKQFDSMIHVYDILFKFCTLKHKENFTKKIS